METSTKDLYHQGYVAGYRDGIRDGASGKSLDEIEQEFTNFPIEMMAVSVRARNCLSRTGCKYIIDVAKLSEHAIETMRNLGPVTAAEIAHWLDDNGICYSAWSKYL